MIRWVIVLGLVGCSAEVPRGTASSNCEGEAVQASKELLTVDVEGVTRSYRLSVPEAAAGESLGLVLAYHGGGGRDVPYPQEKEWEASGFIVAYAMGEVFPGNEGEWLLNTREDRFEDIAYTQAMIDQISSNYCVDRDRVYATGYSLGSMFTYELACQMSDQIAAIATVAGTMPVAPDACDPQRNVPILHVHGDADPIIPYGSTWDWKAWDVVGTMRDVPSLVTFWSDRYGCGDPEVREFSDGRHVIFDRCNGDGRVEHYRLDGAGHEWPERLDERSTVEVMIDFLEASGG